MRLKTLKKDLLLSIYLKGYEGYRPPRWVRRLLAKTEIHHAWLAGYMHVFYDEDGRLRAGIALYEFRYQPLR